VSSQTKKLCENFSSFSIIRTKPNHAGQVAPEPAIRKLPWKRILNSLSQAILTCKIPIFGLLYAGSVVPAAQYFADSSIRLQNMVDTYYLTLSRLQEKICRSIELYSAVFRWTRPIKDQHDAVVLRPFHHRHH
jgi:hypothetical protein